MTGLVEKLAMLAGAVDLRRDDPFARGLRMGYLGAALEVGARPMHVPRVANASDAIEALRAAAECAPEVGEVLEEIAAAIERGLV